MIRLQTSFRDFLLESDPDIFNAIAGEELRQQQGINLIPSENYTYPEVLAALGSVLTNKYCEGYPGRRYYAGQTYTDRIENAARERACRLFRAEHANVQPLSGSPMNQAVYLAFMKPGDTILGMDLSHGGHLTHGAPVSHMGQLFNFIRYKTRPDQAGAIDFDEVRRLARETQPKIVLCGYTSYPREYDYASFRAIATEVGALAMADVSHVAGMIAANVLPNPLDAGFDIVTTTTHKSLRGPRGGMILCRKQYAKQIDNSVFPGLQGGPHMNSIAAAAITFRKAEETEFQNYGRQTLANAKALAEALSREDVTLVTGGTSNHMMVADTIASFGIDGRQAEQTLERIDIATNKQVIPDDPHPPLRPSGIRIGTPASTTRGMREAEMACIAGWIVDALRHSADTSRLSRLAGEVKDFSAAFPIPGFDSLPW
jgi:glycine hydroxymethyltransferase